MLFYFEIKILYFYNDHATCFMYGLHITDVTNYMNSKL